MPIDIDHAMRSTWRLLTIRAEFCGLRHALHPSIGQPKLFVGFSLTLGGLCLNQAFEFLASNL